MESVNVRLQFDAMLDRHVRDPLCVHVCRSTIDCCTMSTGAPAVWEKGKRGSVHRFCHSPLPEFWMGGGSRQPVMTSVSAEEPPRPLSLSLSVSLSLSLSIPEDGSEWR